VAGTIKLSSPETHEFWEIDVLHEDEHLLAMHKPARLLVSPDADNPERPSLMQLLHGAIAAGKPWAVERGITYLTNVHRLDFEATGVLLLAKDKVTATTLGDVFGSEKPMLEFLAIVNGRPLESTFIGDAPLLPHPMQPGVMRVDFNEGKKSITQFDLVEAFNGYSLMRCVPVTNRAHQVRAHLKWAKIPVCQDDAYQGKPLWLSRLKRKFHLKPNREERPLTPRLALHASRMTLTHPTTGAELTIDCPLPKDLAVALKYLRKFAAEGSALPADDDDGSPFPFPFAGE
jgi:RluA family pseudouridine synthase